MKTPRECAEAILGPVDWIEPHHGLCRCPGEALHTNPTNEKHCQVFLDRVPTIHCFHNSCRGEVAHANAALRKAIGLGASALRWRGPEITPEARARMRERAAFEHLNRRAELTRQQILATHATDPADLLDKSPTSLSESPESDWKLLLRLFAPSDIVWIGDIYESGPQFSSRFRSVKEWGKCRKAPGQFICPNSFKPGTTSRSKDQIAELRFLVVESDSLAKPQVAAVFAWMRQFLPLRAVVDTAGKSLHGWFNYPADKRVLAELRVILPALGCDPAMFKPAQPCRLPGALRDGKRQALLWLNLEPASNGEV